MSVVDVNRNRGLESEGSCEVGWLEGTWGPLFAWFHPPAGTKRNHAVLLCEPLGPDRMNLHLSYRELALRLSEAGFATLRFDYLGTGDSSGSPRDPGWPANWIDDARVAASHLLARSGASHLVAFGARFGGTLAMQLAAVEDAVSALILWGPYLDGGSFLRNDRALTRLVQANGSGRFAECAEPGDEAYMGFVYSSKARDVVTAIRPMEASGFACARARIVAWDEASPESPIASSLSERGVRVDFERPRGFVSEDSLHRQAIPHPLIMDTVEWLQEADQEVSRTPSVREDSPESRLAAPTPLHSSIELDRGAPREGRVEERVVRFGSDGNLFGILSIPLDDVVAPTALAPGLVLVNGGNNHRVGINRNYTEWARNAALAGVVTLRMDIRGLGDSSPLHPEDLNRLYRDESRDDVISAIDLMTARDDCRGVLLAGLCAGAYQVFHAAWIDTRVTGLVLLDLLRWDPDGRLEIRGGSWERFRRAVERVAHRTRNTLSRNRNTTRTCLAEGLRELTDREVDVLLVSCIEGGGYDLVSEAIGHDRPRLEASGRFRFEAVGDTNHIFTPIWAQEWLAGELEATLLRSRGK